MILCYKCAMEFGQASTCAMSGGQRNMHQNSRMRPARGRQNSRMRPGRGRQNSKMHCGMQEGGSRPGWYQELTAASRVPITAPVI